MINLTAHKKYFFTQEFFCIQAFYCILFYTFLSLFILVSMFTPNMAFSQEQPSLINYPFSRFFTSAEQRAILDRHRYQIANEKIAFDSSGSVKKSSDKTVPALKNRDVVRLSGIVVRDDGRHVVWINGKSELSKTPPSSITDTQLRKNYNDVIVNVGGLKKSMQAGQVWLVNEDKLKESFELENSNSKNLNKSSNDNTKSKEYEQALSPTSLIKEAKNLGESQ